jgi:hypothetical protein
MKMIKETYFIVLTDEGDDYIECAKLCDRTFDSIERARSFFQEQFSDWMKDEGYEKEEFEIVKVTTVYERNFSKPY